MLSPDNTGFNLEQLDRNNELQEENNNLCISIYHENIYMLSVKGGVPVPLKYTAAIYFFGTDPTTFSTMPMTIISK